MRIVLALFATLVALVALGWLLTANDLLLTGYFAPKYEQVRRNTFEQSKAYNQGMVQELQNMQFEYAKATPEQKVALRSIILHRAADYPEDKMPADLAAFIEQLKNQEADAR